MSNIQKQHKISPAIAWLTIQKFIIFYCPLDGEHTNPYKARWWASFFVLIFFQVFQLSSSVQSYDRSRLPCLCRPGSCKQNTCVPASASCSLCRSILPYRQVRRVTNIYVLSFDVLLLVYLYFMQSFWKCSSHKDSADSQSLLSKFLCQNQRGLHTHGNL